LMNVLGRGLYRSCGYTRQTLTTDMVPAKATLTTVSEEQRNGR
jgi:hypothetical protein